jgi:excisionase family DNA binding protein
MKEWLTIVEAAERLNITPYTLRMWIKRGKIAASKQGAAGPGRREWRVRSADVQAFLGEDLPSEESASEAAVRARRQVGERLQELLQAEGSAEVKLMRIEGFALGLLSE